LTIKNFFESHLVRTLLFIALMATLVACTCFAPQQVQLAALTQCAGASCSDAAADTLQPKSSPPVLQDHVAAKAEKTATAKKASQHRREANTRIQNAISSTAPEGDPSSGQRLDKSNTETAQPTATEPKSGSPQSSQLDDNDSAIKRAKASIAGRNKSPASVELAEMKRSTETNGLGRVSSDVICGYVMEKNASGKNIGSRPFLYLVLKDEVYIGDMIDTTDAYRHLAACFANGKNAS
jgi:hypothetical protein